MNYAIILAGGNGIRMGRTPVPKQFAPLAGKPLLLYSLEAAQANSNIDAICVVSLPDWQEQVRAWGQEYGAHKLKFIAVSGRERQQSVHNGLRSLPAQAGDTVIIMTAVCPFVAQGTIDKHFTALKKYDACITVVKATDAVTFSQDGQLADRTLQKKAIFMQQGPQTYRYGVIKSAHEIYERIPGRAEVTEDSELVLNMGVKTFMVLGDRFCIKVTYPEDLVIAAALKAVFDASEAALKK
jgi:2-C-methyl-D-erythritol 4-phosphate cytidylyltransferase